MSDQFWLSVIQLKKFEPNFPLPHGVPRVDDRKVISGIIHVISNRLRWRDAPEIYGPNKRLYNRLIGWCRMGVFDRNCSCGYPRRYELEIASHLR